ANVGERGNVESERQVSCSATCNTLQCAASNAGTSAPQRLSPVEKRGKCSSPIEHLPLTLPLRIRHETVADAADRLQVPRICRFVLDVASQSDDEVVDSARVCIFVYAPHLFQYGFARHWLPFVRHEVAQQRGFHQRQRHSFLADADLELFEIDAPVAEGKL